VKTQIAVIGLGRFGSEVAKALDGNTCDVLAIDRNENRVREVADEVTVALTLDATDEKALREAGVQNCDIAVVSIGESIEGSVLVVMLLKELGVPSIIAKAITDLHARVLEELGANNVVQPERDPQAPTELFDYIVESTEVEWGCLAHLGHHLTLRRSLRKACHHLSGDKLGLLGVDRIHDDETRYGEKLSRTHL